MRNNSGLTLSELLVALVVVSVGFGTLAALILFSFRQFQFVKEKALAQNESVRFQYMMTSLLSQAVNVEGGNPATAGTVGGIREFNYDSMAAPPADTTLIASFLREYAGSDGDITKIVGAYYPTAIWWVRPTPTTTGLVVADVSYNPGSPQPKSPDYGDHFFSRMTEIQMSKEIGGAGGNQLIAVSVRATFRYFRPETGRIWCPDADIIGGTAGCAEFARNDFSKSFRVILRNNVLSPTSQTGENIPERPLGLLYFFRPIMPVQWR